MYCKSSFRVELNDLAQTSCTPALNHVNERVRIEWKDNDLLIEHDSIRHEGECERIGDPGTRHDAMQFGNRCVQIWPWPAKVPPSSPTILVILALAFGLYLLLDDPKQIGKIGRNRIRVILGTHPNEASSLCVIVRVDPTYQVVATKRPIHEVDDVASGVCVGQSLTSSPPMYAKMRSALRGSLAMSSCISESGFATPDVSVSSNVKPMPRTITANEALPFIGR